LPRRRRSPNPKVPGADPPVATEQNKTSAPSPSNAGDGVPPPVKPDQPVRPLAEAGDLLTDVSHLCELATGAQNGAMRGTYARAAIVLALAAVEAATNDALAAIHTLLRTNVAPDKAQQPPWCHFEGRSHKYISRMLRRQRLQTRRTHVLAQIKRINRKTLSNRMLADLNELARLRNRIVHMTYQSDPDKHQWLFDADEAVKAAALARGYAHHYVDFIIDEFAKFSLPIRPHA
jgi:hypothetical protein